jgi:alpha-galactosidase
MIIDTALAPITLNGDWEAQWKCSYKLAANESSGLVDIRLHFEADQEAPPPRTSIEWSVPLLDTICRWTPMAGFDRALPPDWAPPIMSTLTTSAPVLTFLNNEGQNRLTVAVSEAKRPVLLTGGVNEELCRLVFKIELFSVPEAPLSVYDVVLRLDSRPVFYSDAIGDVSDWFALFADYAPAFVPDAAFAPMYSTWYSYHQNLHDYELEKECELAKQYGIDCIIVDDGWQTDDSNRGYAYCGDWEVSRNRFPDMRAHVDKVHQLGLKYLVWFSVPFVGDKSQIKDLFTGKYLYHIEQMNTSVLDPRFPEVRDYLIGIYENAVNEWDIDGLKLDFIDNFRFEGEDPAIGDDYAGRDIKSVPEAVDVLLSEVMCRLRLLKSDILIEFRQGYIGPAIRKYGNLFRAGDSPADALSNRVRTLDLRMLSGSTAVHSDMLEWHPEDTPESVARQLLNVLFSVPQISMRLGELPESHRMMLKFWLEFCRAHQHVLLQSDLKPYHPELNYPLVIAEDDKELIVAVYNIGQCVAIPQVSGKTCYVVNATGKAELVLELATVPCAVVTRNVQGEETTSSILKAGLQRVAIPNSGLLMLNF